MVKESCYNYKLAIHQSNSFLLYCGIFYPTILYFFHILRIYQLPFAGIGGFIDAVYQVPFCISTPILTNFYKVIAHAHLQLILLKYKP